MSTFISEPGTRLGGRYRLEDRVGGSGGWSAWKAIDETLARPVAVLTFAPGFPRIPEVVMAARAASRLTDARLAQVFDIEETWDQAYVVMEWVASEPLDDLLADGPLEPGRAAEIIAEAAGALSSAHAAGLAHLCLTPDSLRWTPVGGVKIAGVGIDAALAGVTADDPAAADTAGLGRLLYAALTAHWPGTDWPRLPSAPEVDGHPRTPRQVCAGVPAALDDITCQALFQRAGRGGGPPPATPAMLADALAEVAPAPQLPPPATPRGRGAGRRGQAPGHGTGYGDDTYATGGYGTGYSPGYSPGYGEYDTGYDQDYDSRYGNGYAPGYDDGSAGTDPGAGAGYWDSPRDHGAFREPGSPRGQAPPRGRQAGGGGVRGRWVLAAAAGVAVLLVAALALRGMNGGRGNGTATGTRASSAPPTVSKVAVLKPVSAHGFDALSTPKDDPGNENDNQAHFAIDGNARTAWHTQYYLGNPVFGGYKQGSGLILDMGSAVHLASVQVTFGPVPGADVRIEVGNDNTLAPATLQTFTTVASASNVGGTYTFRVHSSATGRYVLIWFTKLPPQAAGSKGKYEAEIFGITVRGSH